MSQEKVISKAERTREYIIEQAAPLFNKKGYAGTSLSDVMETTALSKGAIYGNFENKDELAVAVYQYNFHSLRKRIARDVNSRTTALDKLLAVTDYYRHNWKQVCERGGCPILNAAVEADDHLSYLKKPVQQSILLFAKDLKYLIELGRGQKEIKAHIDVEAYAYTIITLLEGAVMMLKTMNNPKLLFATLDRIDRIILTELKR